EGGLRGLHAAEQRHELASFYLIELHSSRSVRAALQITQMSRGQTAGGEMILQPCQPLVHNPLTDATKLDDRFSPAPYPAVMTPIRRARLSPALDQHCLARCLPFSICLGRLSPIYSSRNASLKSRISFSAISSILF